MGSTVVICSLVRVVGCLMLLLLWGGSCSLSGADGVTARFLASWPGFGTGAAGDARLSDDLGYFSLDDAGLLIVDVRNWEEPRVLASMQFRGSGPVEVVGRWAFLGVSGLQVIDVSNPANPVLASRQDLGLVRSLAAGKDYVCVLGERGLSVLQAGEGEEPRVVATLPELRDGTRMVIAGELAYVAAGLQMRIIDLRDPRQPQEVGVLALERAWPFVDVAAVGTTVFLTDEDGFRVVDTTDASHPQVISEVPFPEGLRGLRPRAAAGGGYLYVGSYDSVFVYDVANPEAPREVFHWEVPMADPGWVTGALGGIRALYVMGDRLLMPRDHDGVEIFSLLDPSRPQSAGLMRTSYDVRGVKASGNSAYLVTFPFGVQKLDLTAAEHPTWAGSYACQMVSQDHVSMEADGTHVYLQAPRLGLAIVDFTEPDGLVTERYRIDSSPAPVSASALSLGNRALLVREFVEESDWLNVTAYDLASPTVPLERWQVGMDGARSRWECLPQSVRFQYHPGDVFWTKDQTLLRFDGEITAYRSRPEPADQLPVHVALGGCHDFIVGNDRHVWLGGDGIICVDIGDVNRPVNLGQVYGGPVSGMALSGDALVVTGPEGLKVLAAATSGEAAVLAAYEIGGLGEVALAGNRAVVARGAEGVMVLDLGEAGRTAPRILRQPDKQLTIVGGNVTFDVAADGALPLTFEWRLNGAAIPGATNSTLSLAKVGLEKNGRVQVIVRNPVGEVTSAEAPLRIDIPPEIRIVSPEPGSVYAPGDAAPLIVIISDADGPLPTAEFFVNGVKMGETGLPQGLTPPTFLFYAEHLQPGVTELQARVRDADGVTTSADPVSIMVTNAPLLQLQRAEYVGREKDGAVTVTVRRNVLGPCAVDVITEDLTARAVGPKGPGQYYPLSTNIQFGPRDARVAVPVQLVNNLIYQGARTFRVRLVHPSTGWSLAAPSEAMVTIEDDDSPSQTNLWTEVVAPAEAPAARGSLQVLLQPPEALGRWRFLWETRWHADGETVSGLVPGNYATVFQPRTGFREPTGATNVIAAGAKEVVTERYVAVGGEEGGLSLTLLPGAVAEGSVKAQWRLQGRADETWQDSGTILPGLPAGVHLVEFKAVPGFSTPEPQMVQVVAARTIVRRASYLLDEEEGGAVWEATPAFSDLEVGFTNGWPLVFAGRLFSDAGSSSGFVVKPRSVLTAAHAMFDRASLTYTEHAWWFFEQHRGEYEPVPQSPRGCYVFAGYAASRTNDLFLLGLNPGESSAASLSLDIAALFFYEDAGRGGYGGFLVSGPERDWLAGPELKMALGYPVDRVPAEQQGRLHVAGPARFEFANGLESLDYSTDLRASPGSSGGPVCVLWTNSLGRPFYFPAAVQVGGSGRMVVRLIDLDVADLISRAEASSNGGPNSTGGGIISVVAGGSGSGRRAGLLTVRVGPPAAARMGGAWRVSPTNSGELGELRDNTTFTNAWLTLAVVSTNLTLEARPLPGFREPTNQWVETIEDANVLLDLRYAVTPPRWVTHPSFGPGLVGTAGTCYRIETKLDDEDETHWLSVQDVALEPGTNWLGGVVPLESTGRVYRAVWLSE